MTIAVKKLFVDYISGALLFCLILGTLSVVAIFLQNHIFMDGTVVLMTAYALAYMCLALLVPFGLAYIARSFREARNGDRK